MTEATRDYGVYSSGHLQSACKLVADACPPATKAPLVPAPGRKAAGVVAPWEDKRKELPAITGDENLVRQAWEHIDGLANMYIWQVLLSF
jgi:hypothetical protein